MPPKRRAKSQTASSSQGRGSGKKGRNQEDEWSVLSSIPKANKINKRQVTELYRFKDKEGDFEGIKYKTVPTTAKTRWGPKSVTMTVYSEREIEKAAWKKHGGPQGFVAFLESLHEKHTGPKAFEWPYAYNTASKRRAFASRAVAEPGPSTSTPAPAVTATSHLPKEKTLEDQEKEVKDAVVQLAQQKGLLVHGHLSYLAPEVLEQIITTVSKLPAYPQRTPLPPIISPTFHALMGVLEKAPVGEGLDRVNHTNLHLYEDEKCQFHFRWTNAFVNEVSHALVDLILAHGLGDYGWKAARWMVYDAWTNSVGGVDWTTYSDNGLFWLIGRVPYLDTPSLPFATREGLDKWMELNALLPQLG